MRIEKRNTFWKEKPRYRHYKNKDFEIWRVGNFDLDKAIEKFKGGKSRWTKRR